MGHSCIRLKVRRRKVAPLAAYSRQFTVKNTTKSISEVVNHVLYYEKPIGSTITNPFTNHKFVPANPHPVPGKFGITITGYDWIEQVGLLWKPVKNKQTPNLRKRVRGQKPKFETINSKLLLVGTEKYDYKSEFPSYTLKKMNKTEYMEKLVQHKLAKWERKNPRPIKKENEDADLFSTEFMIPWTAARGKAEERFRDFVVSIYDKLQLIGRFETKPGEYKEEPIAQLKDINMEGHKINDLPKGSKLMKKAQEVTNKIWKNKSNLISTNLKDHKQTKGRILLPMAA